MFKRLIVASLTLALLLSSLAFGGKQAFAQRDTTAAPGVWSSAILIQNTGTGDADVTVDFYNNAGVLVKTYTPSALSAGRSVTIFVPVDVADLTAGQYSAVVSSSQPVVASVQTSSVSQSAQPWTAFAYEGVSAANTGTRLFFPGNYRNYFSFNSELVIQNAGDADTTLTAQFFNAAGTSLGTVNLGTLARNTAKTYAMSTDPLFAALPSGNTGGIFGAVVTSSGGVPVAGIANIWRTTPTNMTASYNGFTTGSTSLYAPSLTNNFFGFASALTIQNVDQSATANVTITYSNGTTENFQLGPNAARDFYQPANTNLPRGNTNGSFSARVTTTGGSIVGLVSFSAPPELNNNRAVGDFASYNALPTATASVNVPNILSNFFGYFTNVTVQNTGSDPTNITLTYEGGQTWTINNVPANGTANFTHLNPNGSSVLNPLPTRSSVSGILSSSNGQPLVAVIQHNTERSVAGYNAAKLPSDFLQAFTATAR